MVYGPQYSQNQLQNQNLSYGAIKDVAPKQVVEKLPENIQNFDVKDTFENNSTVQMVTSKSKDLNTGLLTAGIWGGYIGLRSLLDKVTGGPWEKSLFGRVTQFGDTLSAGINRITFGLSGKAANGLKKNAGKAGSFLTNKFDLAASFTTPFRFENTTAISQGNGMAGRLFGDDIRNAVSRFDEKKLVKLFGGLDDFKGLDAKGIVAKFEKIATNPLGKENAKVVNDIMETFAKSGETFTIKHFNLPFGLKLPMTGKFNPLRIFQVKMSGSSIANKYKALSKTSAGKTMLGKNLAYVFGSSTEGLTSCMVGGKVAPLIQAAIIANAVKRTIEAPKGEKLSTFMDEMVPQAAFFMTMPYQTKALGSVGGMMKYAGMTGEVDKTFLKKVKNNKNLLKELGLDGADFANLTKKQRQTLNVAHYRDAIENLNTKVAKNAISGVEYQAQVKNIKKILKGNSKWYQKPVKFIGKILGMGYHKETINPLAKNMTQGGIKLANMGNKLKTAGGSALRFATVMFLISPLIAKPITAITHKLFGKPYDPEAKKAEEEKKAQEEALKNLNMTEDEMLRKLEANPEFVQMLQSNPEMMAQIEQNPMLLVQLLASLPDSSNGANQASGGNKFANTNTQSDMLKKYINNPANKVPVNGQALPNQTQNKGYQALNQNDAVFDKNQAVQGNMPQTENNTTQRNYIPSSKPFNSADNGINNELGQNLSNAEAGLSNIPISGTAGNSTNNTADNISSNEAAMDPNVQAMLLKTDKAIDEALKLL